MRYRSEPRKIRICTLLIEIVIIFFDLIFPGFKIQFEIPNLIIDKIYLQFLSDLLQKKQSYKIDVSKQELVAEKIGDSGDIRLLSEMVSDFLKHSSNRNTISFDEKYIKLIYKMYLSHSSQFNV